MTHKNFVKEKLAAGRPVLGIWSIINSALTTDIAAHAGLDFIILDMEHGVYDLNALDNCVRSAESMQCSPFIRVPSLQPTIIQNCLDMGAHGIIVPQQRSYADVMNVMNATKLPPKGNRGYNPFTRAHGYNPNLEASKSKVNNDFGLTTIILENKTIFSELDQILAIPELDMLYLGIYDLSFDLGHQGNVDHPEIKQYVSDALVKIKRAGKYSALMVKNEKEMEKFLHLGVNCLTYGVDTHIYHTAIQHRVSEFKKYSLSGEKV